MRDTGTSYQLRVRIHAPSLSSDYHVHHHDEQRRAVGPRPEADPHRAACNEAPTRRAVAAHTLGRRPAGLYGRDGAEGVRAIKQAGGVVLAQDGATAEVLGMPQAAIRTGCVDHILPLPALAPALLAVARAGASPLSRGMGLCASASSQVLSPSDSLATSS